MLTARLGVDLAEINTRYPVSFAPGKTRFLILRVKSGRSKSEARAVNTLEGVYANNGISVTVDFASDHRNDAAPGADVELGRAGAEGISRDVGWIDD